jgi:single-stranded-DNA-specific exonuclease
VKYGIWKVGAYDEADARGLREAGYSPITAAVLCSRGCVSPQCAERFLSATEPLSDPFELLGMDKAAARVREAIEQKEHIAVFGDYDVDGITATCLLTLFLRSRGAHVTSYIPGRIEEGYGLNETAIRALLAEGVQLIVTVDCGITAADEAALCRRLGISLVITDHHECKNELPEAAAVVDPHRRDQPEPRPELAGVGVAFKLAAAISGDQEKLLEEYCDLLCLGTVADVMPLTGENRTMVARGLRALQNPRRVGLAALLAECAGSVRPITAGTIGYTLAPRINAAGRMGEVDVATELFMTSDPARAQELAARLCQLNRQRQEIEGEIYQQALSMLPPGKMPKAIVLAGETWHQGVVGIVASRLSEEYSCPAFLICLDGEKGKASSRSYGGFNLFEALERLSPLLESYGGHELAAGFTIRRERIARFREEILRLTDAFSKTDACHPALPVDCEIPAKLLTIPNIDALGELEPCGAGCPRPVLYMRSLRVEELADIGGGKHLRLRLSRDRQTFQAIFFSTNARRAAVAKGDLVEIAFTPQVNEFRGQRSVQLNLVDIRPDSSVRDVQSREAALYRRHLDGSPISQEEAAELLPARQEFVAVWRYLVAHAENNCVAEDLGCLSRKISRCAGLPCSTLRTRICLDVFNEQGLLQLELRPKSIRITLSAEGKKADLSRSGILTHLEQLKAGEH